MPTVPISQELADKIIFLRKKKHLTFRQISAQTGASNGIVNKVINQGYVPKVRTVKEEKVAQEEETETWEEGDETAVFCSRTDKPVKSLKHALEMCEVDLDVWYVKKWKCSQWTVPVKQGTSRVIQTQQYMVRIDFERLEKKYIQDARNALDKRRQKYAPVYPKAFRSTRKGNYLGVMGLFDVHFGKLCWNRETNNNYDLKITEKIFENAVEDLLNESRGREISRWLLPLGNDFFHIDNSRNTTFAGTPQDVDGRYAKIFEIGSWSSIRAVERMLCTAPVDVLWIPGNHDPTTSYHLCREIKTHFRNVDQVSVDIGDTYRKYHLYGQNLLGFTHGNEEKVATLPNLMASEKSDWWAKARCRDWFLGHTHKRKSWMTQPMDTHEGSVIRVIKSLSGTDAWHFRKGYIDDQQAAEVFFYERDMGYAGHSVVRARR